MPQRGGASGPNRPKGHNTPAPMNIRSQVQHQQPREPLSFERRAKNDTRKVSKAIGDTIGALVRSGGLDAPECSRLACRTLAREIGVRYTQARSLWNEHAREQLQSIRTSNA